MMAMSDAFLLSETLPLIVVAIAFLSFWARRPTPPERRAVSSRLSSSWERK
jgi:hypothetical protein